MTNHYPLPELVRSHITDPVQLAQIELEHSLRMRILEATLAAQVASGNPWRADGLILDAYSLADWSHDVAVVCMRLAGLREGGGDEA